MASLEGQVAIVTGASSGIGEATAKALAAAGAHVVLAARRIERLTRLADELKAGGANVIAVSCDVRDRGQVEHVVSETLSAFETVDILINNAGVMPLAPLSKCRFEAWDRMIDINLRGALYAIGAVLPNMLEKTSGHIVNIGSVAGRVVFPNGVVYCGTKHALHAVSEGLRAELSQMDPPQHGIRVTTIAPGVVQTELPDSITDDETRATAKEYFSSLPGALQSEDISSAIMFALRTPDHVDVNEVLIRPVSQLR